MSNTDTNIEPSNWSSFFRTQKYGKYRVLDLCSNMGVRYNPTGMLAIRYDAVSLEGQNQLGMSTRFMQGLNSCNWVPAGEYELCQISVFAKREKAPYSHPHSW